MPPTPFAPSHQTPFKSSISTAISGPRALSRSHSASHPEQTRAWPPGTISSEELDAREWKYLAEGGKNLLLRYCAHEQAKGCDASWPFVSPDGREALALRVVKRERGASSSGPEGQGEGAEQEEIDALAWRRDVLHPLLHPPCASAGTNPPSLLPALLEIQLPSYEQGSVSSFLAQVAARIELSRPASRRKVSGIDESASKVWAVQDLSWAAGGSSAGQGTSLSVEIKPKWGSLPSARALDALGQAPDSSKSASIKSSSSRYVMHRLLKQRHQIGSASSSRSCSDVLDNMYDPLLLFADDEQKRREALRRLVWEWRNGWAGSAGSDAKSKSKKSNNLKFFVGDGEIDANNPAHLASLTKTVCALTAKPLTDLRDASSLDEALIQLLLPHTGTHDSLCPPLRRLSHLQSSLDIHDVEGLAQRWKEQTGSEVLGVLGVLPAGTGANEGLVRTPTLQEYVALVDKLADTDNTSSSSRLSLREEVLAYLLSASFKDCSVMLKIDLGTQKQSTGGAAETCGSVKLIDLDPKPFAKLPHYQALDREIVAHFADWQQAAGMNVLNVVDKESEKGVATKSVDESDPQGLEWSLMVGRLWRSETSLTHDDVTGGLVEQVIQGRYAAVLSDRSVLAVLRVLGDQAGKGLTSQRAFVLALPSTPVELEPRVDPMLVLAAGVAALHIYVRLNWTGPELDESEKDLQPLQILRSAAPHAFPPRPIDVAPEAQGRHEAHALHDAALEGLTRSGEPAYHLARHPAWLLVALLLIDAAHGLESRAWWRVRAASIHTRSLDVPMPLEPALLREAEVLSGALAHRAKADSRWSGLHARLLLEHGLALQRAGNDRLAKEMFVDAAIASGLRYEVTGAPGRRTFYQKEDRTQLVLLAESAIARQDEGVSGEGTSKDEIISGATRAGHGKQGGEPVESGWKSSVDESQPINMPASLLHNDDTFMERTRFTSSALAAGASSSADGGSSLQATQDPNNPSPLSPLDACILLAFSLDLRNSSPSHGLVASQISAFVARALSHARNWSVHTMALVLRSRLEAHRTRTAERGVLQLQALVDQMPTADSSSVERLVLFHSLDLPSVWEMRAEVARLYAALGVVRSALEIFERIEMWEEVVACLGALGRQEEGIEVVNDLIRGEKVEAEHVTLERKTGEGRTERTKRKLNAAREAKLWCLLGDLQPDQAQRHYVRAWDVSQASSARAARSLGGLYFALGEHASASTWLKRSLKIAPLFTRSWFMLGCAQMRLERFADAAAAFRRAVALDEEDAESWNNLASCYLRMGSDEDAARLASAHDHAPESVAALDRDTLGEVDGDTITDGLSSRGDSGIEVSDIDEDDVAMTGRGRAHGTTPYELRLLAHRALSKAVRFSRDNWRVWDNYMMVSLDAGYLSEAARALARVIELRTSSREGGGKAALQVIDMKVLQRLVDAVTRVPVDAHSSADEEYVRNPNEGPGLYPAVANLLRKTILDRVAPWPALWQTYARLLLWQGEYRAALEAHLSAWTTGEGPGAPDNDAVQTDKQAFVRGVEQLEELVELLENYSHRPAYSAAARASLSTGTAARMPEAAGKEGEGARQEEAAMPKWAFTARSLVRSFMGRTKSAFEDEAEWERLVALRDELKGKS